VAFREINCGCAADHDRVVCTVFERNLWFGREVCNQDGARKSRHSGEGAEDVWRHLWTLRDDWVAMGRMARQQL
jgi:hypothetical protein